MTAQSTGIFIPEWPDLKTEMWTGIAVGIPVSNLFPTKIRGVSGRRVLIRQREKRSLDLENCNYERITDIFYNKNKT